MFDTVLDSAVANGQIFFSLTRKSLMLPGFGVVTGQMFSALECSRPFYFAVATI
jgi:hypothetical protein